MEHLFQMCFCFIVLVWLVLVDGITGRGNCFAALSKTRQCFNKVFPVLWFLLQVPSSLSLCSFIKCATVQLLVSLMNARSSGTAGRMTLGTNMKNDSSQRRCERLWLTLGSAREGVTCQVVYAGRSSIAMCTYMSLVYSAWVNYIFLKSKQLREVERKIHNIRWKEPSDMRGKCYCIHYIASLI